MGEGVVAGKPRPAGEFVEFSPTGRLLEHGGSGTTYEHYGCRCLECREAHRARIAKRRAVRIAELAADPTIVEHGKDSTYGNYGCRCDECREAHHIKEQAAYARRKASA